MGEFVPNTLDYNILLGEIESGSSGSVANVIRKLREHEMMAYNAGVGGPTGELVASFITALDQRSAERMSDIEKTCSANYQCFIDAIRELLSIQNETAAMGNFLKEFNENLEGAVSKFTQSCQELSNCRVTLEYVDQCIDALQDSLPILDQYVRIEENIAAGQHYHALKALENLEHTQLAKIRPYAFSEIVIHRIPRLRSDIKNASFTELTDFLERIRKLSPTLGANIMRDVAVSTGMESILGSNAFEHQTLNVIQFEKNSTAKNSPNNTPRGSRSSSPASRNLKKMKKRMSTVSGAPSELLSELDELTRLATMSPPSSSAIDVHKQGFTANLDEDIRRIEDLVDFGPVYRCLHIHSVLDERSEFERYYCAQRRRQCQLILGLTPNQQATLRNYGDFFGSICGFFVVEDYLRHCLPSAKSKYSAITRSTPSLTRASIIVDNSQTSQWPAGSSTNASVYYQSYLDELWSVAVQRLVELARNNANDCKSGDELITLKDFVILFKRAMHSLGFPTAGMTEMIAWIQRRYQQLLTDQMRETFEDIIKSDDFTPICINNNKEWSKLIEAYPACNTEEFAVLPFPRHLCFSQMVPLIYTTISRYIDTCHLFCANMDLAYSELEDTVNRAANALFTDCLNPTLNMFIRQDEWNLQRQIQFCANIEELETACGHLDAYLQQSPDGEDSGEHTGQSANGLSEQESDNIGNSFESSLLDLLPIKLQPQSLYSGANPIRSRLQGASLLKDIRSLIEGIIYSHLNDCATHFLSLINYSPDVVQGSVDSASLPNGQQIQMKPKEQIVNLTSWLSNTFSTLFANMPPKVAQTACISVCKHISWYMQKLLIGPEIRELSDMSILQASADVSQCEIFARSQPVPGLDRNMLWLIFADLRQLIDLYLRDAWSSYLSHRDDPNGNIYDRVQPSAAIRLVELLLNADKKRSGFLPSMRKDERDRRKKYTDIIRQLRERQNS